jgi:hypothetical protein
VYWAGKKNNRAVRSFQSADDPVGDHLPAAVLEIDRRLPNSNRQKELHWPSKGQYQQRSCRNHDTERQ